MKLTVKELKETIKADDLLPMMEKWLEGFEFEGKMINLKITVAGNTIGHRALFWIWMRQLAKNFSERGEDKYTDRQMHDLLCHKFLGYTDEITIGSTVIKPALRTLTYPNELNGAEFGHLLSQIDAWSAQVGVLLVTQSNSDYAEYKEANS